MNTLKFTLGSSFQKQFFVVHDWTRLQWSEPSFVPGWTQQHWSEPSLSLGYLSGSLPESHVGLDYIEMSHHSSVRFPGGALHHIIGVLGSPCCGMVPAIQPGNQMYKTSKKLQKFYIVTWCCASFDLQPLKAFTDQLPNLDLSLTLAIWNNIDKLLNGKIRNLFQLM